MPTATINEIETVRLRKVRVIIGLVPAGVFVVDIADTVDGEPSQERVVVTVRLDELTGSPAQKLAAVAQATRDQRAGIVAVDDVEVAGSFDL